MTSRLQGRDVSVVIPVLDHADLLAEAIDSVLGQSEPPGEVVVVDDGSTDGSGDVALRYGSPVRVIRQENRGIAAARNTGVRTASRPLLAFLDADDRWVGDKLRLQLDLLTGDIDIVSGWTAQVGQADWDTAVHDGPARESWRTGVLPGTLLLRRALFDLVGPYDATLRAGETLDWYARALDRGVRVAVLPQVVLLRRVHARNHGIRQPEAYVDYLSVARMAVARRRSRESAP